MSIRLHERGTISLRADAHLDAPLGRARRGNRGVLPGASPSGADAVPTTRERNDVTTRQGHCEGRLLPGKECPGLARGAIREGKANGRREKRRLTGGGAQEPSHLCDGVFTV